MSNFRYIILSFFLFCSFLSDAGAEAQNKAFRSFWHPTYQGERLDYCTIDGKECGKAVANRYCKIMGYESANESVIAYNIGLTHFISSKAQCKGWRCNGFMTIGCVSHLSHTPPKSYHYREKRYVVPRFDHYRVDWCYDKKKGCGSRAAHSFCRRMGYMRAKHFAKETHVAATKTIGSRELCFGNQCEAFKIIVCYR
ncbi:hypothetical protein [Legionella rowbothamii]|uniref:hypothetical protein n=1 Tax=Legionella rowbothamii TaxID=96229 RepID=UPI0010569D96|nr:hypothetical protein [Legionella rowbothamii]